MNGNGKGSGGGTRHLRLVAQNEVLESQGPISRLGLGPRFQPVATAHVVLAVVWKLVLLAFVFRLIYKVH